MNQEPLISPLAVDDVPQNNDREMKFRIQSNEPPLTDEQAEVAVEELNNNAYVQRMTDFPRVERRFADPPIPLQKVGLVSWVPAKGATPNEHGVYGFAKLRGNFASEDEACDKAEQLIRNVDSYHQIYHTWVGRPFPLTQSSDYSANVEKIDLQQEMSRAIRDDVRKKREKEQREIEEIKQREQELLEDVKKDKEDLGDRYTTLKVKKAQLTWTLLETRKKLEQVVTSIAKTRRELEIMDDADPELAKNYYQKYLDARRQVNLPVDQAQNDQNFMKYLVEDVQIPDVDREYELLYGNRDDEEKDTGNEVGDEEKD